MIIIYMMTKNAQPIITLRKWLTACHRKNVEVYNENRQEIMKYNSTINRVKLAQKCTKKRLYSVKVWGKNKV